MVRQIITTSSAPAAIGPYSQAVGSDHLLFISGQLPIDPSSGRMIEGDIAAMTRQILKNGSSIAEAAGTSLEKTLKATIFLCDLSMFQDMNQAYGEFFRDSPPARSTVQVAALPLGSPIEIEFIVAR